MCKYTDIFGSYERKSIKMQQLASLLHIYAHKLLQKRKKPPTFDYTYNHIKQKEYARIFERSTGDDGNGHPPR